MGFFNNLLKEAEQEQDKINYIEVEPDDLIDEAVIEAFLARNNLREDEIVVYAKIMKEFDKFRDTYLKVYHIITINERTAHVVHYYQYERGLEVAWFRRDC